MSFTKNLSYNNFDCSSSSNFGDDPFDPNGGGIPVMVKSPSSKHVACVLLLDVSGSMNKKNSDNKTAIQELNEGLKKFKEQALNSPDFDANTRASIDVAVVTFGGESAEVERDFCCIGDFNPPVLKASGSTPMGAGINKSLDIIEEQKKRYSKAGTPYFRPWVFCITDGMPNDDYSAAVQRLKSAEANKKVISYCVGVEGYNEAVMSQIFMHGYRLNRLNFASLFEFVSNSLAQVSQSTKNNGEIKVKRPDDITIEF